jgi:hypothetical protein
MIGGGNCVVAAIVCIRGGDAFALQATLHRFAGTHIREAIKRVGQQYNCQQTYNDLDAAPHFQFQTTIKFDVRGVTFVSQFHGKARP